MLILFGIISFAAVQPLLFGVPESVGLLAFGVGLTAAAVVLRRYLGRVEAEKRDNQESKKI